MILGNRAVEASKQRSQLISILEKRKDEGGRKGPNTSWHGILDLRPYGGDDGVQWNFGPTSTTLNSRFRGAAAAKELTCRTPSGVCQWRQPVQRKLHGQLSSKWDGGTPIERPRPSSYWAIPANPIAF